MYGGAKVRTQTVAVPDNCGGDNGACQRAATDLIDPANDPVVLVFK